MDVRLINPFLLAAIHVIKTMTNVEPKPGKPFVKKDRLPLGDVSAVIGIAGDARGSMALSFTESCIKAIVQNLLQMEVTRIDEEVEDAVGELTNMICGDARGRLNEDGFSLQASIPTVIVGKDHRIRHINDGPHLAIPFETPYGGFTVEVAFSQDLYKLKK